MKAWVATAAGRPADVLERVEREAPTPGPGELLVAVRMAGVSLPEVLMCRDAYAYKPARPFTPGHEVVGVLLEVPDAAGDPELQPGRRVMGVTAFYRGYGGHAEQALLVESSAALVPDAMPDEHAAVFTIAYHTAYIALVVRARLAAGETLLVHGAAGGTGFAAVQLGKALGARVIAVARGPEKAAACRGDGADVVIDPDAVDWPEAVREATGGAGADVVFDPVGGETFERCLGCLAYGGRLLAVGFASGRWGQLGAAQLVPANASVLGVLAVPPDAAAGRRMKHELQALYERGALTPRVAAIHAFDELPAALTAVEERRAIGKLVVRVATA